MPDKISLKAEERNVLGKKVKKLRREGYIPGHVFGNKVETEHVSVKAHDFLKVLNQAGETGLVDLRIGEEKVRPVLIRELQHDPRTGSLLHIDFYQVNLKEKVTVPVPVVLAGEEPESVKLGETVILQPLTEVQMEALPTDLIENIEVSISHLKNVDDAITVGQLSYDRDKITVLASEEEVVVKLAPAVTEEMKQLLEEQAAEAQAAAVVEVEEGAEVEAVEGEGEKKEEGQESEHTGEAGQSENQENPEE